MKNPICSIGRFERMTKSFNKYAKNQIERNLHIELTSNSPINYFLCDDIYNLTYKIIKKFKTNQYKTKSGFSSKIFDSMFWLSYTVEDDLGKRYFGKDFIDKTIAFKIHMQIGNHRKKRIACWKVKLNN